MKPIPVDTDKPFHAVMNHEACSLLCEVEDHVFLFVYSLTHQISGVKYILATEHIQSISNSASQTGIIAIYKLLNLNFTFSSAVAQSTFLCCNICI